ncbi:MAG: UDP-N-acetylmuramoyl-L-alanyl-D-glutamate--2,6-diaminopimelate ligase [Lachnospiraceae bacterium]|nr:UDP-N-acetylmuramoyl-L-alanyl-D-glutamate--2,6-diaminopimelate ligase [Lachnospiraceae bacterium]
MKLEISKKELLNGLSYDLICGEVDDYLISDVINDTRKIVENASFVCIVGDKFDSHTMIKDIVDKGAKLIVIEHDIDDNDLSYIKSKSDVTLVKVENSRVALAKLSTNYFRDPSKDLFLIGITGTKGKTTTSMIIKQTLENNNIKCGLIGTIGVFIGDEYIRTENTTPESYLIQKYFYMMKEKGFKYVCMEVSSQSLMQNRVYGLIFDIAVFTNIYEDHVGPGEHKDFEDYFNCKLKIFSKSKACKDNNISYETYDVSKATYKNYENEKCFGTKFSIESENIDFDLSLPGSHNVENALCAMTVLKKIGISYDKIKGGLSNISIPGRTEVIYKDNEYTVMVDFAHNALGTKALLETMRQYHKKRYVVVFGCGGGRDKERRYGMGKVCGEMADFSIVTADNSRYEKTMDIINDILSVLIKYTKNYIIFEHRKDAIRYAIENHKEGDLIMVIGKGHEDYNDFNGVKTHFSDKEEILKVLTLSQKSRRL